MRLPDCCLWLITNCAPHSTSQTQLHITLWCLKPLKKVNNKILCNIIRSISPSSNIIQKHCTKWIIMHTFDKLVHDTAVPIQTTSMCFWSSLSAIAKTFITVNSLGHSLSLHTQAQWPIRPVLISSFYLHYSPLERMSFPF